jgi:uncharacterized protein YkwD
MAKDNAVMNASLKCVICALLSLTLPSQSIARSGADIALLVNTVRSSCMRRHKPAPLELNDHLNRAAQLFARGDSPHDAAANAGYQASHLASIHLTGYGEDAALKQLLRSRYCANLSDSDLQHIGIAQHGNDTWLLLGAQLNVPQNAQAASNRVLELVNAARARARRCGSHQFAATTPLALDAALTKAAVAHSQEMAKRSYLEHEGRDGSTPAQRVTRAGYAWSYTGENIAGGAGSPDEVVAGWLNSPGHCANIMTAAYTEMGVAYALSNDNYGIYWTQEFGTRRR